MMSARVQRDVGDVRAQPTPFRPTARRRTALSPGHSTTIVVVEVAGGGKTGLGYTYSDGGIAKLDPWRAEPNAFTGCDAMDPPAPGAR